MTAEAVVHKFTTSRGGVYEQFYAPLLLRAKGYPEKIFLLCRFERHSSSWQAMVLQLDDGNKRVKTNRSNPGTPDDYFMNLTSDPEYNSNADLRSGASQREKQ